MKKIIIALMFSASTFAADVKISQLPLGSGASVGVNDSFPYVQASNNLTKRLTIYDLVNVPLFVQTYAPKASPTFTGVVTAPSFVGSLTGNSSTATALAANPTDCAAGQYANAIAANGNLTCSAVNASSDITGIVSVSHGGTGQSSFTAGYLKSNGTTISSSSTVASSDITGVIAIANGGTGQASFSSGYLKSTGSTLASSPTVASSDISGVIAIANGGTNNGSLAVTAGGVIYTDGTKLVNVGAGTSGFFLKSNGSGAPSWVTGMTNPLTTTGDIIYSSSGTTPARLGIGSTGNRLIVSSGLPAWGAQYVSGDTVVYSARLICSTSGSSIVKNYGLVSAIGTRGSVGCTVTLNSGLFNDTPSCTSTPIGSAFMTGMDATSSTSYAIYAANGGGTFVNSEFGFTCVGIKP